MQQVVNENGVFTTQNDHWKTRVAIVEQDGQPLVQETHTGQLPTGELQYTVMHHPGTGVVVSQSAEFVPDQIASMMASAPLPWSWQQTGDGRLVSATSSGIPISAAIHTGRQLIKSRVDTTRQFLHEAEPIIDTNLAAIADALGSDKERYNLDF